MLYLLPVITVLAISVLLLFIVRKSSNPAIRRRIYANAGLVCAVVILVVTLSVSISAQDSASAAQASSLSSSSQSGTSPETLSAVSQGTSSDDKNNPETGALIQNAPQSTALGTAANDGGKGLGYLAAGLCTGLSCVGAGIAIASTAPAAIGAFSENPKAFGKALIFVVLGEGVALYGLIISFLLMNKF